MQQQQYPPPNPEYQQYPPPSQGGYSAVSSYGDQPPQQQQQQFQYGSDAKVPFDEAFKIERPKYNDVWAGVLFLVFMAGFTVVSGIALHGYGIEPHLSSCATSLCT